MALDVIEEKGSNPDRYLTLAQVCELTSFGRATVRNAERRGKLPAYRPLGRLRFKLSDVVAFIESSRNAPRRVPPPQLLEHAGRYRRVRGQR